MLYQKRPVLVEAVRWLGHGDDGPSFSERPGWLAGALGDTVLFLDNTDTLIVKSRTLAKHTCLPGDYIVRGGDGGLYVMTADGFGEKYEPVGRLRFWKGGR